LAGPTPRSLDVETWRKEAIRILNELEFDGIVYIPELENDNRTFNYENQVWWEREALYNASIIVFWIPRSSQLPGYTTNVEYGYWIAKNSNKCLYGRPDNSERNKYLDWLYQVETGNNPMNNLEELLKNAVKLTDRCKNTDIDTYELNIITRILEKYPEVITLVGDVEFTPEKENLLLYFVVINDLGKSQKMIEAINRI